MNKFGLFSQTQDCNDCLVGGVRGGAGKVIRLSEAFSFYGLAGGRVQAEHEGYGTLAIVPEVGAIVKFSTHWKSYIQVNKEFFRNGKMLEPWVVEISNRFGQSSNWDIRLDYLAKEDKQIKLSFARYW